jgi:nitroimidazol reductase NimA-like FMN-containing flavoprotein (pyridoxamine 5'-phosphate oxidase superfamily)
MLSGPRSQNSVAWQPAEGDSEMTRFAAAIVEPLDEAECLQLISAGGIGRIGYTGRYGPTVLPVNFVLYEQAVVFRTGQDSPLGEDLRTGIADADYLVAFEVDEISPATREGWSVLIQGSAHHVDSDQERAQVMRSGVEAWPGGEKDLFIRILPTRITGRRIRRSGS